MRHSGTGLLRKNSGPARLSVEFRLPFSSGDDSRQDQSHHPSAAIAPSAD